ncbi:MAG: hypothetical protein ACYTFT_14850, partial [Planctomycetota bacterium]
MHRSAEVAIGLCVLGLSGGALAVAIVHAVSWWGQAVHATLLVRRKIAPTRLVWQPTSFRLLLAAGVP